MKHTNPYALSVKLITAIVCLEAIAMATFIILSQTEVDFDLNWNMFDSFLLWPLAIIGFFVGLGQKFGVYKPVIVTKYADGRPDKVEDNHDITETMFAGCIMPLLQYLLIWPLIFAAMIYYALMVVIYIFGVLFPYLIAAFIIFSLIFFYKCDKRATYTRFRNILVPGLGILFIFIYWLIYHIWTDEVNTLPSIIALSAGGLVIITFILILAINKDNDYTDDYDNISHLSGPLILSFIVCSMVVGGVLAYTAISSNYVPKDYYYTQEQTETYTVKTNSSLNVRSGPGSNYNVIGSLANGEKIEVISIADGWAKIQYKGTTGYASSDYLTKHTSDVSAITDNSPVKISKTTGVIDSWNLTFDSFSGNKRLTEPERKNLCIDKIDPSIKTNELAKGKIIYSNEKKGRLETLLYITDETFEYLVSYDTQGNYISHIIIGELRAYSNSSTYGEFNGNKLILHNYVGPEPGYDDEEITKITFTILPDLTFKKD